MPSPRLSLIVGTRGGDEGGRRSNPPGVRGQVLASAKPFVDLGCSSKEAWRSSAGSGSETWVTQGELRRLGEGSWDPSGLEGELLASAWDRKRKPKPPSWRNRKGEGSQKRFIQKWERSYPSPKVGGASLRLGIALSKVSGREKAWRSSERSCSET